MQIGVNEFLHLHAGRTPPTGIVCRDAGPQKVCPVLVLTVYKRRQRKCQREVTTAQRPLEQECMGQMIGLHRP